MASYWLVNIPARVVEVYGDPAGGGASAAYRIAKTFGPDGEVPVVLDGREVGRVDVRSFLP